MSYTVKKKTLVYTLVKLVLLALAAYAGFRGIDVGADTPSYARHYQEQASCMCIGDYEIGFELLSLPAAVLLPSQGLYFSYISAAIFFLSFYAMSLIIDRNRLAGKDSGFYLFAFLGLIGIFLINPLYQQAHINAIRHGLSAMAVVIFVIHRVLGKTKPSLIWGVLAVSFHWSALMYVPLVALVKFSRIGLVFLFLVWNVLVVLYLLGTTDDIVLAVSPQLHTFVYEYGVNALGRYRAGVRVDFALFTYVLVIGSVLLARARVFTDSILLKTLPWVGMVTTIPFYVLGWGFFSNRYLLTPWILFSVIFSVAYMEFSSRTKVFPLLSLLLFGVGVSLFTASMR